MPNPSPHDQRIAYWPLGAVITLGVFAIVASQTDDGEPVVRAQTFTFNYSVQSLPDFTQTVADLRAGAIEVVDLIPDQACNFTGTFSPPQGATPGREPDITVSAASARIWVTNPRNLTTTNSEFCQSVDAIDITLGRQGSTLQAGLTTVGTGGTITLSGIEYSTGDGFFKGTPGLIDSSYISTDFHMLARVSGGAAAVVSGSFSGS